MKRQFKNPKINERQRDTARLFFGWTNVKWFISQIGYLYSSKPSFFSKKRVESGVAFIIGQTGMILFLLEKYKTLSMSDFLMWASLEFAVGGYITYQIQRQKKTYLEYEEPPDYETEPNYHEQHHTGDSDLTDSYEVREPL